MAPAPPLGISPAPLATNVDVAVPARQTASLNSEQKLIDYIARLQTQGLTTQSFSNPTGLASEALRSLKGYFERANSLNDQMRRKVNRMDQDEDLASLAQADHDTEMLPSGPAGQALEPAGASGQELEAASKVTQNEIERLCMVLIESARYGAESAVITTASGNVNKSVMMLVRGQ